MKNLITCLSLLVISSLTSCAFFAEKKQDETYKYLTNTNVENKLPEDFREALERKGNMAGGFYKMQALPLAAPYVDAQIRQMTLQKGLNENERQLLAEKLHQQLTKEKTCFEFSYEATRFSQVADLKNWKITFVDNKNREYHLTWNKNDLKKESISGFTIKSGDKLPTWSNQGTACTDTVLTLKEGFSIKVKPDYVQFPFDSTANITWDFPKLIKTQRGEEVYEEFEPKTKKGYRGW